MLNDYTEHLIALHIQDGGCMILAENKSGYQLLEYISISENDFLQSSIYKPITGSFAFIKCEDKYLIAYNKWRNQWEFPAGKIEAGETYKECARRELLEETNQSVDNLEYKGAFKVLDKNTGQIKFRTVYYAEITCLQEFITNNEMNKIMLWDLKSNIGYFDEVDLKMMQICMKQEDLGMKDRVYQIFRECFPNIRITEEILYSLMDYNQCTIIGKYEDNKLIGFSAVRDNLIVLLCVAPTHQRKGYGSQLVQETEKLMKKNGYDTVIIGGTDSKFFMGAVCEETEWNESHNYFFEKCGYSATNGCIEMEMQLKDFSLTTLNIDLSSDGITFEYWNNPDKTELLSAVHEVEEDWVKYFEYDVTVYVAMEKEKCVGFTILSFDDITLCNNGHNRVGMVGCVGVIPSKRKFGIGLVMVAQATNELKTKGCDISYIHYTHLDKWYGKLGYQSILWYWFGKKNI